MYDIDIDSDQKLTFTTITTLVFTYNRHITVCLPRTSDGSLIRTITVGQHSMSREIETAFDAFSDSAAVLWNWMWWMSVGVTNVLCFLSRLNRTYSYWVLSTEHSKLFLPHWRPFNSRNSLYLVILTTLVPHCLFFFTEHAQLENLRGFANWLFQYRDERGQILVLKTTSTYIYRPAQCRWIF